MPRPLIPHRASVILDRAEELFCANGYDRTSIAEISTRSGIAKGAVYREFPSKEAVLDALLTRSAQRMLAEVRAEVEDSSGPVGLAAAYRFGIRALLGEPLARAFLQADTDVLGSYIRDRSDDRYAARVAWVMRYLDDLQRAGAIRSDVEPEDVSIALSALTVGVFSIGPLLGGLSDARLESALDVITSMVESGLDRTAAVHDGGASRRAQLHLLDRVQEQLRQFSGMIRGEQGA